METSSNKEGDSCSGKESQRAGLDANVLECEMVAIIVTLGAGGMGHRSSAMLNA